MATIFTDASCAAKIGQGWNKAVCKPIRLCEYWPGQEAAKGLWGNCREQ